jgi:hypothetical protein
VPVQTAGDTGETVEMLFISAACHTERTDGATQGISHMHVVKNLGKKYTSRESVAIYIYI